MMVVVSRGRAPLKTVASKLLGPAGSVVQVVFRRGPKTITLQCQHSVPDIKAAQLVRASDVLLLVGELRDAREALVGPVCLHKQTAPLTQCACSGRCCRRLHVLKENATNPSVSPATSSPGASMPRHASSTPQRQFSQSSDDLLGKAGPGGKAFSSIQARGMKPEN